MTTKPISPRKALNKAYLKAKPTRAHIERFKAQLLTLLEHTNDQESEEHHKNLLADFLKKTYYDPQYFINTKERKDLVIHNGPKPDSTVGVIIEAKKPTNRNEMPSRENLNAKAFHELLYYYLQERITHHNLELKHLVITNIHEWYIFDAHRFHSWFGENKKLISQFTDFTECRLSGHTTDFFYKEIAAPAILALRQELTFTYVDIRDYEKPLRNQDPKDDSKLIVLYKLLSPPHLLKLPFENDSNSLDKKFYTELLHIIGLTEKKEGSKKVIGRHAPKDRLPGSILENTINQLETYDKMARLVRPSQYGHTEEERLFNVGLELTITWINRILFLKLLEAQLISYHKGNKTGYSFLNIGKVSSYDDLSYLFFKVLARKHAERSADRSTRFDHVPYLNSSLFEPTDLEQDMIQISNLQDDLSIPVLNQTVLMAGQNKKRTGTMNTLEYLFAFLDAYDFSSEGGEDIQEENKSLINASVLGLIFEKINGYKDGSFFTPGFITMYMCRETIRQAVVQKFEEAKGWTGLTFEALYDKIEDRKEANDIINSLRICDPAVGSGHFLVSALNEIIALKHDLKILSDRDGRRLKEYHVDVVNDELIITDEDGELFEYHPGNKEKQRVQEALFHEKQTLIENCLFGVDINPNSVKICRLRLWIELLKHAYYKNEYELETLPNIDINIKCGNSLVSRFAIDADLRQVLRKNKKAIENYRIYVSCYRNAQSKEEKREMEGLINKIKSEFRNEISVNDSKVKDLSKVRGMLMKLLGQTSLMERTQKEKQDFDKKAKQLTAEIEKLEKELEEIKSDKIYENAFEWRFEFPEVLDDEGDFVGFDVVIGNPPYIPLESIDTVYRQHFREKYKTLSRKYDTSVCFILEGLQILNFKGQLSYIAPITWQTGENYIEFRKFIINNFGIKEIINLPFDVFEDAYVDTSLYFISKLPLQSYKIFSFKKEVKINSLENIDFKSYITSDLNKIDYKIQINDLSVNKFNNSNKFISLGDITISTQGLSGSKYSEIKSSDLFSFPYLSKGNIYNYKIKMESIIQISMKDKRNLIKFYTDVPKILIRRIINRQNRLTVTYFENTMVFKKDINPFIPIVKEYSAKYLCGILASRFISKLYLSMSSIASKDDFRQTTLTELRKLPIPIPDQLSSQRIEDLVTEILKLKKLDFNADTTALETEVDNLVYKLYLLTDQEIEEIEEE